MPPKLDKNHGFMKAIVYNQVARDQYDKEVKMKQAGRTVKPTTTTKKDSAQLYVPPHLKNKNIAGAAINASSSSSSSPSHGAAKRTSTGSKRQKRATSSVHSSELLFIFEYEDETGESRQFNVNKSDVAEDLAEMFGNQLGLTKDMKRALEYKLSEEINNCHDSL